MSIKVLVVDNYDSFVYNLVQGLGELAVDPIVYRNDAITIDGIREIGPDLILISPGPGRPEDAGISMDVVRSFAGEIPILGVCLGHQCIGQVYGGRIVRAKRPMHGKTSTINHDAVGLLAGMPNPFQATRYHSLIVERDSIPTELDITATCEDGVVMGLRHHRLKVEGVQFHPESILTPSGQTLLKNFVGQVQVVA